jgi:hypothetical protein
MLGNQPNIMVRWSNLLKQTERTMLTERAMTYRITIAGEVAIAEICQEIETELQRIRAEQMYSGMSWREAQILVSLRSFQLYNRLHRVESSINYSVRMLRNNRHIESNRAVALATREALKRERVNNVRN